MVGFALGNIRMRNFIPTDSAQQLADLLSKEGSSISKALSNLILQMDTVKQETTWQSQQLEDHKEDVVSLKTAVERIDQQQRVETENRRFYKWAFGFVLAFIFGVLGVCYNQVVFLVSLDRQYIADVAIAATVNAKVKKP